MRQCEAGSRAPVPDPMDLNSAASVLSNSRLAQLVECKQGSQDCTRWYGLGTINRYTSGADIPSACPDLCTTRLIAVRWLCFINVIANSRWMQGDVSVPRARFWRETVPMGNCTRRIYNVFRLNRFIRVHVN
jgi:hypothetical protein